MSSKGNKKKGPKPSPKPASVTVVVYDPPSKYDATKWQGYKVVPLDENPKVVLVASQGQEIRFVAGQSSVDEITIGGDSNAVSPTPNP